MTIVDHKLKVFIEVAERKNFTKAGEVLHMTQPAVSQAIVKLEEVMQIKLIERTNKTFYLNKAGEIVYKYAKKMAELDAEMKARVIELASIPSGPLIIGASYTIGEYILPDILVMLHEQYPKILPHVIIKNTDEIGKKLLNHEIDIGFIEGDFNHPLIDKKLYSVDEMYVYYSKRLNFKNKPTHESLVNERWMIREEGSGTRKQTEKFFNTFNIKPKKIYTLGSTQIIKEAVESGLGISLISKWAMKKEMKLKTISRLDIAGTPITRDLSIVKLKQDFTPMIVRSFEEIIWKYKSERLS